MTATKTGILIESLPWLKKFRGKIIVVKFGGNAMVDTALQRAFAQDMVYLHHVGVHPVVVHGGGPQISARLAERNIQSEFRAGLRVTTPEVMAVVREVLAGEVNAQIVDLINEHSMLAVGMSGESGGMLQARQRTALVDGMQVDIGLVGDVIAVDPTLVLGQIAAGHIPVISSFAPDADVTGRSLNINADSAAAALAVAVGAAKLVVLTDVAGLYRDWPDRESLVSTITADELHGLLPTLESGMIPKMTACLDAVRGGVPKAAIIDGRQQHSILLEIFTQSGIGTEVVGTAVVGSAVVGTAVANGNGGQMKTHAEPSDREHDSIQSPDHAATEAIGVVGDHSHNWRQRFTDAMMGSSPAPLAMLTRGERCYVWDVDGRKYLDFLAGIAVNALGHAHPVLVEAVSHQISTLAHVSNYFATPPQLELAERLRTISGAGPRGRVFFANSGAEAIEAGLKLARLNKTGGERLRILSLKQSFHGRTTGALALTGQMALQTAFEPLLPGIEHIDSSIEALEAALDTDVAALILEPIKGEAGVLDLPDGYLERARELTRASGTLLILDEIQTGIGRTGHWFAFQEHGIVPDAIAIAKGLAGGVPIGALVTFGDASDLFGPGSHGSTFGGNPLATAAANAVLGEIERAGLIENAKQRGEQLRELIHGIGSPLVAEIRGSGLLIGVGLHKPIAKAVVAAALERGLIINAANESTIRIAPPLIVGDAEIAEFNILFTNALEATA